MEKECLFDKWIEPKRMTLDNYLTPCIKMNSQ